MVPTHRWNPTEDQHRGNDPRKRQKTQNYYLEIRGTAVVVPDDYVVADRIAVRYNADFRTLDGPNSTRVIIDITPERFLITDVRG